MKPIISALLSAALFAPLSVHAQDAGDSRDKSYWERAKDAFEQLDRKRAMEEAQRLYQQAKAAGEKVPSDVLEWAREDLARAGRWEYKVLELDGGREEMESRLNEHGRER